MNASRFCAVLTLCLAQAAVADAAEPAEAPHAAYPQTQRLIESLATEPNFPPVREVTASEVDGLLQLELDIGPDDVVEGFATKDGKDAFLVLRHLRVAADGALKDRTGDRYRARQALENPRRLAELEGDATVQDALVFSPEGEVKAAVYLFTDVDCGYCQRFHDRIEEYNALGIEVRYLAFPRAGVGSDTYDKTVSAWCARNPHRALTKVKKGKDIPERTCDNPVEAHYELGKRLGVAGTPSLVAADTGHFIPGYLAPEHLAAELGLSSVPE